MRVDLRLGEPPIDPATAAQAPVAARATGIRVCAGRLPGAKAVRVIRLERETGAAVLRDDPGRRFEIPTRTRRTGSGSRTPRTPRRPRPRGRSCRRSVGPGRRRAAPAGPRPRARPRCPSSSSVEGCARMDRRRRWRSRSGRQRRRQGRSCRVRTRGSGSTPSRSSTRGSRAARTPASSAGRPRRRRSPNAARAAAGRVGAVRSQILDVIASRAARARRRSRADSPAVQAFGAVVRDRVRVAPSAGWRTVEPPADAFPSGKKIAESPGSAPKGSSGPARVSASERATGTPSIANSIARGEQIGPREGGSRAVERAHPATAPGTVIGRGP